MHMCLRDAANACEKRMVKISIRRIYRNNRGQNVQAV